MSDPGKPRFRKRKLIAKGLGAALLLALALALSLALLWERGNLQPWLKARIVELYLRKVQPRLPFTIESADVDTGWRDLLHGKVNELAATLRWGAWRIPLSGPIQITRAGDQSEDYLIRFSPEASIEPAGGLLENLRGTPAATRAQVKVGSRHHAAHQHHHSAESSTTIQLAMEILVNREFSKLKRVRVQVTPSDESPDFQWPHYGVDIKNPRISVEWDGRSARAEAQVAGAHWATEGNRELSLGELAFQAQAPLTLKPFHVGPDIALSWKGQDGEALFGETYLALPLSRVPGSGTLALGSDGKLAPERFEVVLGDPGGAGRLHLNAAFLRDPDGGLRRVQARWKLDPIELKALLATVLKSAGALGGPLQNAQLLRDLDLRAGRLRAEGSASAPWPLTRFRVDRAEDSIDARVRLEGVEARLRKAALGVKELSLDLPLSTQRAETGSLSAGEILFRRFRAHLASTELGLALRKEASGRKTAHFDFHLGNGTAIPLSIEGFDLKLQRLWGILGLPDKDEPSFHYELESGVALSPTPAERFAAPLCLRQRIPPAQVSLAFPKIDLAPGTIDPTGELRVDLFGGSVVVREIGFFQMGSPVPEIDFDAEAKGLRLDSMGAWFEFGKMDGVLNAYAHDVTFQSWLPTHYDFRVEVAPLNKRMVDWSPEAFKSFLKVFMNTGIERLPGIAQWVAFGWPAHLLGGYDIWNAGISLFSNEGSILLETIEPKDVYEHWKKHFILSGRRISIPLLTRHYPVVLDSNAISEYLHEMIERLGSLKKNKKENPNEDPSASCLPPGF